MIIALLGVILVVIGIYQVITAFYVDHIHEFEAPAALQAAFSLLVMVAGIVCLCGGIKNIIKILR